MINDQLLIQKYDRPGPRYTSYPAHPHWKQSPSQSEWLEQVLLRKELGANFDLYVHIPFCSSLCIYCGCSRVITKDMELASRYVDSLIKEWNLYQEKCGPISLSSIHLGGGTPTFLEPILLNKLITSIKGNKDISWGAVEVDPRVTTKEHCDVLIRNGFQKFSLGIQDFDPVVQKNINRKQPYEMVEDMVSYLRDNGVESINFDIIYGLPGQSVETIKSTFEKVERLKPDTIAFYSYAHVPWKIKSQKALERIGLPKAEEKRDLYEEGKRYLEKLGYAELGMDHFSLKDDQLYHAYEKGELKRSFMGYTSKKGECLIGLGCSSISSSGLGYVQNEKDVTAYMNTVNSGNLPLIYGHTMSQQDKMIDQTIQDLMCQGKTDLERVLNSLDDNHVNNIRNTYNEMMSDGLLNLEKSNLEILEKGKPFVRNICMALDPNLKIKSENQFSRTI